LPAEPAKDVHPLDDRYPPAMAAAATRYLRSAPMGTRVVARYRVPGGFTDALGYLRARDRSSCDIDTRRGLVAVPLADVVAAKQVPEPPARRSTAPQTNP
jgi:hypothetical protein